MLSLYREKLEGRRLATATMTARQGQCGHPALPRLGMARVHEFLGQMEPHVSCLKEPCLRELTTE